MKRHGRSMPGISKKCSRESCTPATYDGHGGISLFVGMVKLA